MTPTEVNQLTIPEYSYMVKWIVQEAEEQRKQSNNGLQPKSMKQMLDSQQEQDFNASVLQALAYQKLSPIEKYRLGLKVLDSR